MKIWQKQPLPLLPSPLLGRAQELAEICAQLRRPEVRLLTLTGPPGVGKTRLGLQVADTLTTAFADGVAFVSLASTRDSALVIPTIAQSFGLGQEGERTFLERLQAHLHTSQLLLLLDNCEQVTEAAPSLAELLTACPGVKLLATSRAPLHLRVEQEYPVLPLAPPNLQQLPETTALAQNAAVALFVQRAQALQPHFQLTAENASAIAQICTYLDGLPLALELAAARIKLLPPHTLLARLRAGSGARLQILTGGPRDLPVRQQTLRNTLAWSYDLLDAEEQRLFLRLAVFTGGSTLDAVEAAANQPGEPFLDVFDKTAALVDKNLLRVQMPPRAESADTPASEPRLTMLESIRDYALEQLIIRGEEAQMRNLHAHYYCVLAEGAEAQMMGQEQRHWFDRLTLEHENLRAALHWALTSGDVSTALRIGGALWQFWFARGYMGEGLQWLQRALDQSEVAFPALHAKAAGGAAILAAYLGHYGQASLFAELSLMLCRQLNVPSGTAAALNGLAFISGMQGDHAKARRLTNESVTIARTLNDPLCLIQALYYTALTAWLAGDYPLAQQAALEGLMRCQAVGDARTIASFQYGLGLIAVAQSEHALARPFFEESLLALRSLGDKRSVTMCLAGLADIALSQQDAMTARALTTEALVLLNEVGDRWFTAYSLDGLAAALTLEGQTLQATRLFAAADSMRHAIGAATPAPRQAVRAHHLPHLRKRVGEQQFATAWGEGQRLTLDAILTTQQAKEQLTRAAPSSDQASSSAQSTSSAIASLTRREREVLRLLVQGLTDAQIAEKLVISPHTVHTHLSTIYSKLGVPSRTAAAHLAVQNRLI